MPTSAKQFVLVSDVEVILIGLLALSYTKGRRSFTFLSLQNFNSCVTASHIPVKPTA